MLFKRIEQNLKIKSFLGRSKNAVMMQTWVALTTFFAVLFHNKSQIEP